MIEFNKKTNTLEQVQYKYTLQDVSEPNLIGHFLYQPVAFVIFIILE